MAISGREDDDECAQSLQMTKENLQKSQLTLFQALPLSFTQHRLRTKGGPSCPLVNRHSGWISPSHLIPHIHKKKMPSCGPWEIPPPTFLLPKFHPPISSNEAETEVTVTTQMGN